MKILKIQKSDYLQFKGNNIKNDRSTVINETTVLEDSVNRYGKNNLTLSEFASRLEDYIRKLHKKNIFEKFEALQKAKDIKHKIKV